MSNENVNLMNSNSTEDSTEEHMRGLISQNFRASKPFFDRKRPRDNHSSAVDSLPYKDRDFVGIKSPGQVSAIRRIPLAEIAVNMPSPSHVIVPKSTIRKNSSITCIGDFHKNESETQISNSRTISAFMESDGLSDSFITPMERPDCSILSDSFSTPSLLDDDFDESLLKEIDEVYEQKSATKAESQGTSISLHMKCQYNDDSSNVSKANPDSIDNGESVGIKTELNHSSVSESRSTSNNMEIESMPDESQKYLQSLNDKQREAACSDISVPLMIVAGPGSGKTSTMVGRVLMMLNEGIHPSNILAMTFTTAAASEMRDRVGAVAGKTTAKELTISTFHSFSLQLCRLHAEKLERSTEFLIYGHGQQRRAIIEAVRLLESEENGENYEACEVGGGSNRSRHPEYFKDKSKKWQKFVTQAKASGKSPSDFRKKGDEIGATVLQNYNNILRSCNALDYHDLISCSVKLLNDFPEVFKECQDSWKAIIIDEFQDTSAMQYSLLRTLASHGRVTIVGDDDQSIFSFNGADVLGFDSFRKDFPNYKEIRLVKNYRSTRCIVEAASSIIQNNKQRCQSKDVVAENSQGSKIFIKECHNEDAQCAFVVDKILEIACNSSADKCSYSNIAILYRRQVSGKLFQTAFRERKIPFNVHGVAFYRKKVVKAIIAMLRTTLSGCDDGPYRQVFKALLPCGKEEKKRVISHIDKISTTRKSSFISAACDIFIAKISGTFKRNQLTQGRKVLLMLEMISKLVQREQSISAVITSVANMVPQKYLLEQQAAIDVDGRKLLNEDNDIRSVLQYLLDDVSNFLSTHSTTGERNELEKQKGCSSILKAFIDYISERERENFRIRRCDNGNSVTLTTIHQSKGLEWDIVFIVKANETEIPLLHEFNATANENRSSIEEERRLFYVAMTRARKKLLILFTMMDASWQMLQPSRFLKEIPDHLQEIQGELTMKYQYISREDKQHNADLPDGKQPSEILVPNDSLSCQAGDATEESIETEEACFGNGFLRRFTVENRSVVSHLFHQWAKKRAFQEPRRLLDKVRFVINERLTVKKNKHKDVLLALKSCLSSDEAFQYAEYVLRWEQIPADTRAHLTREKQEHFQKLRIENSMSSSAPTTKQIAYLQSLGCTVTPTSRLHASRLIEQYKSL